MLLLSTLPRHTFYWTSLVSGAFLPARAKAQCSCMCKCSYKSYFGWSKRQCHESASQASGVQAGADVPEVHCWGMSRASSSGCKLACRYRKRGVNDAGRVANEVEIEQVVDAGFDWRTGFPLLASLVQVCTHLPKADTQPTLCFKRVTSHVLRSLWQRPPSYLIPLLNIGSFMHHSCHLRQSLSCFCRCGVPFHCTGFRIQPACRPSTRSLPFSCSSTTPTTPLRGCTSRHAPSPTKLHICQNLDLRTSTLHYSGSRKHSNACPAHPRWSAWNSHICIIEVLKA